MLEMKRIASFAATQWTILGGLKKVIQKSRNSIQKIVDSYIKKDDAPGPSHGPNNIAMESPSAPISTR
jgi:hypothetical protein